MNKVAILSTIGRFHKVHLSKPEPSLSQAVRGHRRLIVRNIGDSDCIVRNLKFPWLLND
jgi:hypothetical protein